MRRLNAMLLVPCVALASIAYASSASVALHNARLALESYETEPTLAAIRDLGSLIPVAESNADRNEATFLRSVAAADLLLVAQQRNDSALRASVANALGYSEETVASNVQRELTTIARGIYANTANDSAKAMALLSKTTPVSVSDLQGWSGVRRDLFMLSLLRTALESGREPLAALETLGTDPCADPKTKCRSPFVLFDVAGRKAIAALTEVSEIVARLQHASREGDPLSRVLADDVARSIESLAGLTLRPTPTINQEWELTAADGHPVNASPDLLVVVGANEARFGFVPRVRLTAAGEIEVFAAGSPMLTSPEHVAFPTEFAPSIRPITELADSLEAALGEHRDVSVAIGATPDAPAHLIWRVLHSIRGAGARAAWLLARSPDGVAQAIPMEVISSDDTVKPASVSLRIRLGGYTVKIGNQEGDIPRVKLDDGWRFDLASLDAAVAGRQTGSAEVSFMGDLAAQHLVEAAFRVAPQNSALRLVIP